MCDIIPRDIKPVFPQRIPRETVRAKIQELLGLGEIPANVDFALGAEDVVEGIGTAALSYRNSLGETVPGLLMKPLGRAARAGIVCIPGETTVVPIRPLPIGWP